MKQAPRSDDFAVRRERLRELSDVALRARFWQLTEEIVAPLLEQARTHTTPSIERSVVLRMGFSSVEASELVKGLAERGLLGHGAGRLILQLAQRRALAPREAGLALLEGRYWEELAP